VDHLVVMKQEPNAEVVLKASRERFWTLLCDSLRMD
jgi:inosine-uridine nucleoside N-ribohydrolase